MTEAAVSRVSPSFAWLRSPQFDLAFVVGLPALAILTAAIVVWHPALFIPILIIDLWFLGYHHVISTYTQICFDQKSLSERWPLLFIFLPLVAVTTIGIAYFVGIWIIVSIYFYWQWYHYSRQSWGISRAYRGRDKGALYEDGWLDQAIFYAIPVSGILYRSNQDPGTFLGLSLSTVPVPNWVVTTSFAVTAALFGYWAIRRIQAWCIGKLSYIHTLYLLTHFVIFTVGYMLIEDITYGWLAINIWHNAQYILFVWMFNVRRFKGGIDPQAKFLSYISQPQRLGLYLLTCVAITGVFYG
jgi:hypothetical protein